MKPHHQISDRANEVQLSASAISKALINHQSVNIKTKKRITNLGKQTDHKLNMALKNQTIGKSSPVGLIIPSIKGLKYREILLGIESKFSQLGLNIILVQTEAGLAGGLSSPDDLFYCEISALIVCMGYPMSHKNYLDKLIQKGVPIISIETPYYPGVTAHWLDHSELFKAGLQHLAKASCNDIGLVISGNLAELTKMAYKKGYHSALSLYRPHQKNDNIFEYEHTPHAAKLVVKQILSQDIIPDGLFFTDEYFAISVMNELQIRSINIPNEIAILGLGNAEVSGHVIPSLSCIDYLYKDMGKDIANFVINAIYYRTPNAIFTRSNRYELKVRDTTTRWR